MKTDIRLTEPTSYFNNEAGESDLTVQEVIALVNVYVKTAEEVYKSKMKPPG